MSETSDKTLAGLIRRAAAYLIDYAVLFAAFVITQSFILKPLRALIFGSDDWMKAGGLPLEVYVLLTISLPAWLYFAANESGARQATIGKRILGLIVADVSSKRISFGRALLRTIIKLLPWELSHLTANLPTSMWFEPEPGFRFGFLVVWALLVVYLALILLTRRKQSLHDIVAGTVVINTQRAA